MAETAAIESLGGSGGIVHTTDGGFEDDVLKADRPVLVDYWAEWCGALQDDRAHTR